MWWGSRETIERLQRLERKIDSLDAKLNKIMRIDPDKVKAEIIKAVTDNITDSKEDSLSRIKAAVGRVLDDEER